MANFLKDYISKNHLSVLITGKQYVMVEGWQVAGSMLGLYPRVMKVEKIDVNKWMAQADIVDKTGRIVSTGFAICSKTESKKSSFDEYAILSMAQTRAIGKAYRNLIGWVVKMAGYEATPAEEIKDKPTTVIQSEEPSKTNYLENLKKAVYKAGAKTEAEAVKIINERTGLVLKDFNITEKNAQLVLFAFLNEKK